MSKIDIPVFNFEIYRGDDREFDFKMTTEDGTSLNLTGFEFSMLIKPKQGNAYLLKEGNGLTVKDAVKGEIKLTLNHDLTKDWQFTAAQYDLQAKINGIVKTFIRGLITIIKDVTP